MYCRRLVEVTGTESPPGRRGNVRVFFSERGRVVVKFKESSSTGPE